MVRLRVMHLFCIINVVAALSAADYYISSLPGLVWPDNTLKMHAGHVPINTEHHGEMFFWHVQRKHVSERQKTVIWLNGGPGCSSMDGLLLEIGPFRMQDAETLVENKGSWHEYANLLFVDNPLGTGFSLVDSDSFVSELDQMTQQFMDFMDAFLNLFPEYAQDDLYLAGESFAGQYIPYIGKAMLDTLSSGASRQYQITGLLIGNGWIDPMSGYSSYLPFAVQAGLLQPGTEQYKAVAATSEACDKEKQTHGSSVHNPVCEQILSKLFEVTLTRDAQGTNMCFNVYDYNLRDTYPSCGMNWPSELQYMNPYLRRKDVLEAIHATDKKTGWTECNGAVGAQFRALNSKPSSALFPDILKHIPILLFSGSNDVICNSLSTTNFIDALEWNGKKGFESDAKQEWSFEDQDVGHYRIARNLTYVEIYNASHMVPYDKPALTRNMLDRFMGLDAGPIGTAQAPIPVETIPETPIGYIPEEKTTTDETTATKEAYLTSKLKKLKQYYKAGSVALVVVLLAVAGLVFFIYKHRGSIKRRYGFDKLGLQESGRANETELEELTLRTPLFDAHDTFDIGSDDEPEDWSKDVDKPLVRRAEDEGPSRGVRSHRD